MGGIKSIRHIKICPDPFCFSYEEVIYHARKLSTTRSVPGNHKHEKQLANGWLKFKDSFMLLNYISTEQSVKILV